MSYSVNTAPGADPGGNTKDNQDAWVVRERLGAQEMALFGVFDGHGQEGKAVSHHVTAALPQLVARSSLCKVGAGPAARAGGCAAAGRDPATALSF